MQIGMVGLGRMGANMVRRLMKGGHTCVVFDADPGHVKALAGEGARPAAGLDDLVRQLGSPAVVWMMLPAGEVTESTLEKLSGLMKQGDCVVDGGNAHYKDDVRRAAWLEKNGIDYLDAGTSGGVWGLERGYCLMVGGPQRAFKLLEPALKTLAPGQSGIEPSAKAAKGTAHLGYLYCGPAGAGHFVKMVHNGIEYGLMQAYAEGFDLLYQSRSQAVEASRRYTLPLGEIAELWRRGSVVASWLLDLSAAALAEDPQLAEFTGRVEDSGEGRWSVEAALESAVPVPVISAALYARFRSRQDHNFGEKLLSAMRKQFGGHQEKK